jgi:hypothetical protein
MVGESQGQSLSARNVSQFYDRAKDEERKVNNWNSYLQNTQ